MFILCAESSDTKHVDVEVLLLKICHMKRKVSMCKILNVTFKVAGVTTL
jgi:hypothetical protein